MGLEIESGRRACQNCRQCHISANKPKRKNKIIAKYTGQVHGTCIQKKAKRRFFNPIEKGPVIPRLGVAVFVRSLSLPSVYYYYFGRLRLIFLFICSLDQILQSHFIWCLIWMRQQLYCVTLFHKCWIIFLLHGFFSLSSTRKMPKAKMLHWAAINNQRCIGIFSQNASTFFVAFRPIICLRNIIWKKK